MSVMGVPLLDEEVVSIEWADGKVFGILHAPVGAASGLCLIMLTSGMQSRVGPGRIYLTAARRFADAGMHVLRVDLSGAGDSERENSETHFDCHSPAEVDAAIRYVKGRLRPHAIVLQGLCAGARVAIKASANPDIEGILAWSAPIYSASLTMPQSPHEPKDRISDAVARLEASRLLRFVLSLRFLSWRWWRTQFPSGKGVANEADRLVRAILHLLRPDLAKDVSPFLAATQEYLSDGRRILFVYGDLDKRSLDEFRDCFPQLFEDGVARQGFVVVDRGTHTFSCHSAQQVVIELSMRWVESQFPVRA